MCTGQKFASYNDGERTLRVFFSYFLLLVYIFKKIYIIFVEYSGKTQLLKSWRTSSPELISVSPLALAVGQEITQLVLKGRNLVSRGTK